MSKLNLLVIFAFVVTVCRCDLIGWNRLSNNVNSHSRFRTTQDQQTNHRSEMFRMILENRTLSVTQKRQWFEKLLSKDNYTSHHKNKGRFNLYIKRMHA